MALEDHAVRACLAGLGIQHEAQCLAGEADHRDGVDLALRVGGSGDDTGLGVAKYVLGCALWYRDSPADRQRALELMEQVRDMCLQQRFYLSEIPAIDSWAARDRARQGDRDGAIPVLRQAVGDMFNAGQLGYWVTANALLVETLLERGGDDDEADAEAAIDQLAAVSADHGWVISEVWLLRLRALLARARRDEAVYRAFLERYRAMARSLGFEGHTAWAEAMT